MKIALIFILMACRTVCLADDWTTGDTVRQSIYTALVVIDWKQSSWAQSHPRTETKCTPLNQCITISHEYIEANPILGTHPSQGKLNNLVAASIVGHAAISYMLPRGWREGWQYVWIGIEGEAVNHNRSIGIKMRF